MHAGASYFCMWSLPQKPVPVAFDFGGAWMKGTTVCLPKVCGVAVLFCYNNAFGAAVPAEKHHIPPVGGENIR